VQRLSYFEIDIDGGPDGELQPIAAPSESAPVVNSETKNAPMKPLLKDDMWWPQSLSISVGSNFPVPARSAPLRFFCPFI
jgi:hypothetical protein